MAKRQGHKEETPPSGRGQQKEETVPDNFLRVDRNDWGLCPVCHSKVLKVRSATRLENFPMFCKRCRAEHLVNWWNVGNQRTLYNKHISEGHIREQAYKGTEPQLPEYRAKCTGKGCNGCVGGNILLLGQAQRDLQPLRFD